MEQTTAPVSKEEKHLLQIYISPQLHERIKAKSREKGIWLSKLVQLALEDYLGRV